MANFNAWNWTGRGEDPQLKDRLATANREMQQLRVRGDQAVNVEPAPKPEYVPIKYNPVATQVDGYTEDQLKEYAEVAEAVGVSPVDMIVEEFKAYLRKQEFPVYDLKTVVSFMDEKSRHEGKGWGWSWLPLREKDRIKAYFGKEATRREPTWGGNMSGQDRPSSDFYSAHRHIGMGQTVSTDIYSKTVPLHALKKVAKIEQEFRHTVAFMVCDYAPAPAFKSDPFLMAVIQNNRLDEGYGRFVIDVWDEPGFGLEHMLKSGL